MVSPKSAAAPILANSQSIGSLVKRTSNKSRTWKNSFHVSPDVFALENAKCCVAELQSLAAVLAQWMRRDPRSWVCAVSSVPGNSLSGAPERNDETDPQERDRKSFARADRNSCRGRRQPLRDERQAFVEPLSLPQREAKEQKGFRLAEMRTAMPADIERGSTRRRHDADQRIERCRGVLIELRVRKPLVPVRKRDRGVAIGCHPQSCGRDHEQFRRRQSRKRGICGSGDRRNQHTEPPSLNPRREGDTEVAAG